jgi:hypothetical protein
MQDVKRETAVNPDGSIKIHSLPFPAGARVEVIVRSLEKSTGNGKNGPAYPLRGTPIQYDDPFAEADKER